MAKSPPATAAATGISAARVCRTVQKTRTSLMPFAEVAKALPTFKHPAFKDEEEMLIVCRAHAC